MRTVAMIPARGGSKGIAGKNLKVLAGKPLLAYSIEAACNAETVDRVYVSTDSPEIGEVAKRWGAEVIWRPAELAGDLASSESALLHALEEIRREGSAPETLVFLQCTAPLTRSIDIDGAVRQMVNERAETCVAVTPFHYFLWRNDAAGAVGVNHDKMVRLMRQEREPQYLESGAIYVMNVAGFIEHQHRFFGKTALYVMDSEFVQEIDDPVDLVVANVKIEFAQHRSLVETIPRELKAVVVDFDGVLTNHHVLLDSDGNESIRCSTMDERAVERLRAMQLDPLFLSSRTSPAAEHWARRLGVDLVQNVPDKLPLLTSFATRQELSLERIAFLGQKTEDARCLLNVGCGVAVLDAEPGVLAAAKLRLKSQGGSGALHEFATLVAEARG